MTKRKIETNQPSGAHLEVIKVADFIKIKDNPKQRDTALHADKSFQYHLSSPHPSHTMVAAAQLPSGHYIKLDGHTRSFLWDDGRLKPFSDKLQMSVYPIENISDATELYDAFDNATATKTVADTVQSAYRMVGLKLTSNMLRPGSGVERPLRYVDAFQSGNFNPTKKADLPLLDLIRTYSKELTILDGLNLGKKVMPAPYMIGALAVISRDGEDCIPFLKAYSEKLGIQRGHEYDSVAILENYICSREYAELKTKVGISHQKLTIPASVFMNCYEAWSIDPDSAWFSKFPISTRIIRTFFQ